MTSITEPEMARPKTASQLTKEAQAIANGTANPAPDWIEPAPDVIAALVRVMRDLPAIGKDQTASPQLGGYAYRGIEQITRHTQGLFARHGIVFVPRVVAWEIRDITVNGKPWTDTIESVEYDVYGPGGVGDKITVGPILAIGRDNSDKGANKCLTQALKYALLQALSISDGRDDADGSTHERDAAVPPPMWDRGMVKQHLLNLLDGDRDAAAKAWEFGSGDALTEWSAAKAEAIAHAWKSRSTDQEPESGDPRGVEGSAGPDAVQVPLDLAEGDVAGRLYNPKNPPSDVLEAAIDRAKQIPDAYLDWELTQAGQAIVDGSTPDVSRRRLVLAWMAEGWVPEGWEPAADTAGE